MTSRPADAVFFESPVEFRAWLDEHAATATEQWVGFHRRASGRPTMTWAQSVDEALCVGWIDGRRQGIDDADWAIRFTPRRPGSNWSAVNVRRVPELVEEGRMKAAGLRAFEARDLSKTPYSYEAGSIDLDPVFGDRLRANAAAWAWFSAQAPSYRRGAGHWIMSAKRDETRERRLEALIDDSAHERPIKPMSYGRRR